MSDDSIHIHKASVHNLKQIDVTIPRDRFIVITGVSGSGKSSLAFDTLYAEGQRLYVESLSAYARQFLGRMNKPEVEYIHGIPPAIAIEQRVRNSNPRSTVGTMSEVYDYLRLLFARIGRTYSPLSGEEVKKHSVDHVVDFLSGRSKGERFVIIAPVVVQKKPKSPDFFRRFFNAGFNMVEDDGSFVKLEDMFHHLESKEQVSPMTLHFVVDRLKTGEDNQVSRLADSVQKAFDEADGRCLVMFFSGRHPTVYSFSKYFEADGMIFEEPGEHLFSFNNPLGACPTCGGYGNVLGIDERLVVPDKKRSIYEDAIACWRGEKVSAWKNRLIERASVLQIPIHKPYYQLSEEEKDLLWHGGKGWLGIKGFFSELEEKMYKIQNRVLLARYRGKTECPDCKGMRLRKETSYVKIDGHSIQEFVSMPIKELLPLMKKIKLDQNDRKAGNLLLQEIISRLQFLMEGGGGYLTLNRASNTLSGGESQRIHLASSLGSSLAGALYILDEPSIGLHPRDTHQLIKSLKKLRDIGNTVIVVEHDEDIIRAADYLIDIGPFAGNLGGELVFNGDIKDINQDSSSRSLTLQYLSGTKKIEKKATKKRKSIAQITIEGVRQNNLKDIDVSIPLGILTAVTGVSGSGKTSLVSKTLFPALKKMLGESVGITGEYSQLSGDLHMIHSVELVDQTPIGRSSRSNPATYIKAWDDIRKLFAEQNAAKQFGLKPSHFSFNIPGGRCEACQGEGEIKVEMQFMADVAIVCEECEGKRFKDEVLAVQDKGKHVNEILNMTVDEAIVYFEDGKTTGLNKKISERLQRLVDVGLGYVKLGQSSSTLSGGEAQRVKLASFLLKKDSSEKILFIFDEPTTGLHFHDINKLLDAFDALIKQGHSIVVVEHNMEIIKMADWIIDLGPEGGEDGGHIVFEGTPEKIIDCKESFTGQYLLKKTSKAVS